MNYTSTRNNKLSVSGSTAVLTGLAPDGGLYVPESFPAVSREDIERMTVPPSSCRNFSTN